MADFQVLGKLDPGQFAQNGTHTLTYAQCFLWHFSEIEKGKSGAEKWCNNHNGDDGGDLDDHECVRGVLDQPFAFLSRVICARRSTTSSQMHLS